MKIKHTPIHIIKQPTIKICTDENGLKFYVSGIENDNGIWSATIKYIESGKFKKVSYNIIEKYL